MPAVLPALLRRLAGPKPRRRPLYESTRGEALETRVLPSAVAAASKATLTITGDADASDLQIEQVATGVKVTALNGTQLTVGGNLVPDFTFTGVTSLNVKLGEGDDSVSVLGALNLKNVTFSLGDGDNSLDIAAGMNVTGKLAVTGGTGADLISLNSTVGKSLSISTGLGNDEVTLLGTSFSSTASITTSAGADIVTIDEASVSADAHFNNTLTIATGEDNDTVSISNSTTKKVSVNTGDDDDGVTLDTVNASAALSIQTSAGSDDLTLRSVIQTGSGTNSLNVGTGADDVIIETSSFSATTTVDLGTGIVNTLSIDDTSFSNAFNLNANGGVDIGGIGDRINIETNTALVGVTNFSKAVKMKVGAHADINLGVLNTSSTTHFLSSLSISGINPAADLTVAVANNTFFSLPNLNKVLRADI